MDAPAHLQKPWSAPRTDDELIEALLWDEPISVETWIEVSSAHIALDMDGHWKLSTQVSEFNDAVQAGIIFC